MDNIYDRKKENLKINSKDDIDSKLSEILNNYKSIIVSYVKDITGKSIEEISEKELYNYMIDMIYISTNTKDTEEMLSEFSYLSQQDVKQKLAQNAYVRETLNKKFGIKKDYKFEGEIGDHGICDSLDFSINDISHIVNKDITSKQFDTISAEYITGILDVIKRNPNLNVYFVYNSKKYNDTQFIDNYSKFLDGEVELNMENKIIFKEMINLIATYSLDELLNKKEYVKKEIVSGIYDYIKMPEPKFSKIEREKLNNITDTWNRQDIANYNNLALLFTRYKYILENNMVENNSDITSVMDEIGIAIKSGIPCKENVPTGHNAEEFSENMNKWYSYFEEINREDIMSSVYRSKSSSNINKRKDVPTSLLVHFYNPKGSLTDVFKLTVVNRARKEHGEEPIAPKSVSDIYKNKTLRKQIEEDSQRFKEYIEAANIEDTENELRPDMYFQFEDGDTEIPRKDVLSAGQKQLACYLINKESLIDLLDYDERMTSGSGNVAFAVGFSNDGVQPKNILLSCDINANSNLGVSNIPCEDSFKDLSKTYKELNEVKNQRTEVLLSRDDIKPNYLLILSGKQIDEYDMNLIQEETEKAKKLGIDILSIDIGDIIKSEKEINSCDEKEDR